jgi:NTE family protein
MKIGLVLSGGAAKGAYHIGVLKAFAEHKIEIDIYAGASIGALNALLAATSNSITGAHLKLKTVWDSLAKNSPLKINNQVATYYLLFCAATLAQTTPNPIATALKTLLIKKLRQLDMGIIDDQPVIEKFADFVDLTKKNDWKEVWVSTFEGSSSEAIFEFIRQELNVPGKEASYHCLNTLDPDEVLNVVLASAALPLLYPGHEIKGKQHHDGGIRDNTPVKSLLDKCDYCFVTHLSNGSNFDRHSLANSSTQIIEIRPGNKFVTEQGKFSGVKAMMNFNSDKISYLKEMGYQDTNKVILILKRQADLSTAMQKEDDEIDNLLHRL